MTGIDWLIVGVIVLLGLFGWAQGFVAGALALFGFAVGAWIGTRIGPLVLDEGRRSPWSPAFGLVGALIAGMVFAIGFEGHRGAIAGAVRVARGHGGRWVPGLGPDRVRRAGDRLGARRAWRWPTAARRAGEVQRSTILQALNTVLPPSGGLLDALARLDPFPRIDGPEASVPAPTRGDRPRPTASGRRRIRW